jgi:zinc/manganese transport system substrate-binding protein
MLEPFHLPFVQRGIVEVLVLAPAAGLIGTWIVLRGLAFYAHAVGTAAFPGLVLADGLGFGATIGAAGTGLLVAAGVGWLARREDSRERYDALTALVFGSAANVETLLFGSLLLVDGRDIAFAAAVAVLALAAARVLEPRWLIGGFDPATARALGVRSAWPDAVLLVLVALTAVAALATLGALLATALLVVPAATTRLWCDRVPRWQVATILLVALEGVVGLWLSVEVNAPPGAAIAVLGGGVFALAALARVVGSRRRPAAAAAAAVLGALVLLSAGCGSASTQSGAGGLRVVATTTQLGDVVRAVGGTRIAVTQLLRPNTDPHEYEPRPRDVLDTAQAKLVVVSGDGLDHWMGDVLKQSGANAQVLDVSAKLPDRLPGQSSGAQASRYDPHWWHDPRNVETAVGEIRDALTRADPAGKATYARNAAAYAVRVRALDRGIARCMAQVPAAGRRLVTNHDAFAYFAHRYGITVVGAVIPSQTTQAQPSAGDVARLVRVIERERVRAVFPESSVNARLARAIAQRTGARSDLELYGDTLGAAGSAGATYLSMERANADAMVRGFTGGRSRCAIAGR